MDHHLECAIRNHLAGSSYLTQKVQSLLNLEYTSLQQHHLPRCFFTKQFSSYGPNITSVITKESNSSRQVMAKHAVVATVFYIRTSDLFEEFIVISIQLWEEDYL